MHEPKASALSARDRYLILREFPDLYGKIIDPYIISLARVQQLIVY